MGNVFMFAFFLEMSTGEPLAYGVVTGVMLALLWIIVLIVTYIYYKINPPQKH